MSSILTNNSAITALQTLRNVNQSLAQTQDQISTGKKVATAKDNAAFFAISAVMQSDVTGFKALNESLALGDATLSVGRSGAETVTGLLDELKGRIVGAQEDNVDRAKIQADASELINQVRATVDASQFNGQNLLKNVAGTTNQVDFLASLNRSATGVTTSSISVQKQSLEAASTTGTAVAGTAGVALTASTALTVTAPNTFSEGDVVALSITNSAGEGVIVSTAITAADLALADADALATAVAGRLNTEVSNAGLTASGAITVSGAAGGAIQVATDAASTADTDFQAAFGGGLTALSLVDVSTEGGAAAALTAIEGVIQTSVNAASAFGSGQKRVEIQTEFNKQVSDSLTSGIGALVDADLEAASARLQALQVQQQLGIQALSIANQQPQSILALFR